MSTEDKLKNVSPTFGNTLLGAVPLVSEVYLMDNIVLMKHYPDKYFDLAVVDPPYGINGGLDNRKATMTKSKNCSLRKLSRPGGTEWDKAIPPYEYFIELFRVSKNQIIWGGNYFIEHLPSTRCMITWDKMTYVPTMSQVELAWTSFTTHSKLVKINSNQLDRFHISQKPIQLYDWIFAKYATEGMKILDTHLGSGSSRISANKAKLHFVGCEIDEEYFNKQNKRYEEFVSQARLW